MKNLRLLILFVCCTVCGAAISNPITPSKARLLARQYMVNQRAEPVLVKEGAATAAETTDTRARLGSNTRSCAETSEPTYYIFSRGEGRGFVIVSGDDAVPEVLGYTEQGDYDEDNAAPFLRWYLDYYSQHIAYAQANGLPAMTQPSYATTRQDIEPLMETKWGQGWPYNNLCPDLKTGGKCATGCVATAGAQVVYYWRRDLTYETLTSVASKGEDDDAQATLAFAKGTPLKWDLMQPSYSGSEPEEYCTAAATLVALIGAGARLDYGSSTAGHNADCIAVYNNVLGMNGGTEYNKDWGGTGSINYSDAAWSKLLYEELLKGHPIHYSGYNNNNGGHAVVCDGYRAKDDFFHINMGWNGGSDGFYTTNIGATSGSWGFTDAWQTATIGTCAKTLNLQAKITLPLKVYKGATNTITVTVTNHGTLDYSGISLYGNTTGKNPTSQAKASSTDETTIVSNDGTETRMSLTVKPTAETYYIYVTDTNRRVLARATLHCEDPETALYLTGFDVEGSADWEGDCNVVYNDRATVGLTLENRSTVPYEGSVKADIYASADGGETYVLKGSRTGKVAVPALGSQRSDLSFYATSAYDIQPDTLYRIRLQLNTTTGDSIRVDTETTDSPTVGFVLRSGDLTATDYTDGCLSLEGKWDYTKFNTLAKKTLYKGATSYDLTRVEAVGRVPESPVNPNAVFYVGSSRGASANVVVDGVCDSLVLTAGHDFAPREGFVAEAARVDIQQEPNKWYLFTAPCDLEVGPGMVARTIDTHNSLGIGNKTTDVRRLEAGKTYLLISCSSRRQVLESAKTGAVAALPEANADTAVVGTLTATATPAQAMLPDMAETQYFQPVNEGTEVEALRGFFCASNVTKAFKAYSMISQDPKYNKYGEQIEQAYDLRDEYMDLVAATAVATLQDSIALAEARYSARELSVAEVTVAMKWLEAAMEAYSNCYIDPSREADYTSCIQNPSFESSATLIKGWEVSDKSLASIKLTTNKAYAGVGSDGKYLFYSTSQDKVAASLSQTVVGLPAGIYRLTAKIGTQDEGTVTLSANEVTVEVREHKYGRYYLNEVTVDSIYVHEGETLRLSLAASECYKADDFRLTYIAPDPVGMEGVRIRTDEEGRTPGNSRTYDLSGRSVGPTQMQRGIYITNGRKYMKR